MGDSKPVNVFTLEYWWFCSYTAHSIFHTALKHCCVSYISLQSENNRLTQLSTEIINALDTIKLMLFNANDFEPLYSNSCEIQPKIEFESLSIGSHFHGRIVIYMPFWKHVHVCVPMLTHWAWVTHKCFRNPTIIVSDNGLSPSKCQAIIWTNAGILLNQPLVNYLSKFIYFNSRKCTPNGRLGNGSHFVPVSMC